MSHAQFKFNAAQDGIQNIPSFGSVHFLSIQCQFFVNCANGHAPPLNWRNGLLDVWMLLENHFMLTYRLWVWKFICSHAGTPPWLDDAKECIQSAWSKYRDFSYVAHGVSVSDVRVVLLVI